MLKLLRSCWVGSHDTQDRTGIQDLPPEIMTKIIEHLYYQIKATKEIQIRENINPNYKAFKVETIIFIRDRNHS